MAQRRRHGGAFKTRGVVEAIAGHKTVNEIASTYEIHPSQVGKWKAEALRRAALRIGHSRVRRLLRWMGLETLYPKPRLSVPGGPEHRVYPVRAYLACGQRLVGVFDPGGERRHPFDVGKGSAKAVAGARQDSVALPEICVSFVPVTTGKSLQAPPVIHLYRICNSCS
jgi:transposase